MCACLLSFCCSPQKVPVATTLKKDLHLLKMPKKYPAPYLGGATVSNTPLSQRKISPQVFEPDSEIKREKLSKPIYKGATVFEVLTGKKFPEEAPVEPSVLKVIYPEGHAFNREPQ